MQKTEQGLTADSARLRIIGCIKSVRSAVIAFVINA
jgi:hypothetical protein